MLKIGHSIKRPGRKHGDDPITINVPEELETDQGNVQNPSDVDFYSREEPLEDQNITHTAVLEYFWQSYTSEMADMRRVHNGLNRPIVAAAKTSGQIEPDAVPVPGVDVSAEIKAKAQELGFGEVGFTKFDKRYTYKSKKDWVKFPHAVCIAYEQPYEATQAAPGPKAVLFSGTYRACGSAALHLAEYIRSLGYHAQVHNPTDDSGPYIPMFVEAGLGQLGANGQLLSPHFGSRARLLIITTDAQVTYDQPVDYGVHSLCDVCQVCVNRCPGRALIREKVWWRGVYKNKVIYRRCVPMLAKYESCSVCMKVCPVQRYGMKPVMDHYANTGQVLGKGTHMLEGFSLRGMGYFGPGELPAFDSEAFRIPHGTAEDMRFEELKESIASGLVPDGPEGDAMLREFKRKVDGYLNINKGAGQTLDPKENKEGGLAEMS